MQINSYKSKEKLIVKASGRLDASWADYFADTVFEYIRQGEHHLLIDAEELIFLSSAGIRSLVKIYKEVKKVGGEFAILEATSFVNQTIKTTGFGAWLSEETVPENKELAGTSAQEQTNIQAKVYVLHEIEENELQVFNSWQAFAGIDPEKVSRKKLAEDCIALGIGAPDMSKEDEANRFGEFLGISGHLIYQPPDLHDRPDFFIPMENYLPGIQILSGLCFRGKMTHLMRFSDENGNTRGKLSQIAEDLLQNTGHDSIVTVILGEIKGLVGATMVQSPSIEEKAEGFDYPGVRNRLNFCGEKVHARELALIVGFASNNKESALGKAGVQMKEEGELYGHFHAAVFPYQPIKNGIINLREQVAKLLDGPTPKAVLHLVNDSRNLVGLGESELIRGAAWFASINEKEEKK